LTSVASPVNAVQIKVLVVNYEQYDRADAYACTAVPSLAYQIKILQCTLIPTSLKSISYCLCSQFVDYNDINGVSAPLEQSFYTKYCRVKLIYQDSVSCIQQQPYKWKTGHKYLCSQDTPIKLQ